MLRHSSTQLQAESIKYMVILSVQEENAAITQLSQGIFYIFISKEHYSNYNTKHVQDFRVDPGRI